MKTFRQFVVLCEKYSEEHAHRKLWNYFISHPEHGKEVRDAILKKDYDKALEIMSTEVNYSKTDTKHPLHFDNAKQGFSAKHGKRPNDEDDYHREIDDAIHGVLALASQKKLKGAVEKMHPARVTGGSDPNAKLSKTWKSAGGKNVTPKGDLEIYNPDNPKERRGISMKKGGGAQLASAEAGELLATYKAASKSFVQRFHGNKSKEERNKIQKDIMDRISRVANANTQMKTASDTEKQALKTSAQDILDSLHDEHPNLTRHVSQVSTSGQQKFGGRNAPGTAGVVLTGKTSKSTATAKSSEQQVSARPRQALPKGTNRPGNVKIDYRPAPQMQKTEPTKTEPTPRQSKISQLRQSIASRQAVQQKPEDPLAKEKERIAKLPIHRQAQALSNAVGAHMRVQQTHQQSQQLIKQSQPQQPIQSQQTSQPIQPSVSQSVVSPENEKERRRRETRQRMDAAGQRLGAQ